MIPQDVVRREMLWAHDGADTAAIALLMDLLEYGYEHSEVTILEGILHSTWYRPVFIKAIRLFHEENIHAYYYDLPFEETLRRHETKSIRFDFGEKEMRGWWHEKDYMDCIQEATLTADVSLEDAVLRIISDIQLSR